MFGRKKETRTYDHEKKIPVIHASICTGEKVAGFKDKETNHFEEIMLIRSQSDLEYFMREYGVEEKDIKKEW